MKKVIYLIVAAVCTLGAALSFSSQTKEAEKAQAVDFRIFDVSILDCKGTGGYCLETVLVEDTRLPSVPSGEGEGQGN